MTAQVPDTYRVAGKDYAIIAMSAPIDFYPWDHGLEPTATSTACWRGYVCEYDISREKLWLDTLRIHCGNGSYPALNGVEAVASDEDFERMHVYKGLNIPIDYDGSIVLGDGFLNEYYIHMGFQRAWAYKKVIELVFEHGKVVNTVDHGEFVAKLREKIDEDPLFMLRMGPKPGDFIEDSFSLDMKTKAWWI